MRLTIAPLLLALFGGPAAAQEAHPDLAAGLEAYEFFCSKCHGKNLVTSGVSAFDLRKFPVDEKDRFYTSVKEGKGDMPAWGDVIYPEELDALWVYVATRGGTQPFPEEEQSSRALDPETLVTEGTLTACLARNAGALSGRRSGGGAGFDYRISTEVAAAMGLQLDVVWIENEAAEESDPVHETYAMLAYGLCDIVPSHPLYARAVGAPPTGQAALPRWLGMPEVIDAETQRRVAAHLPHVTLKPVAVTSPYMRAEIGMVYRDGAPEPQDLAKLDGRRLAYQQGTLSGALLQLEAAGVVADAISFNPGPEFLWGLENGAADVAIVDIAAFDAHRKHNPVSTLKLAAWRHKVGLDIGIAVLAENEGLAGALNQALQALRAGGALPLLAAQEKLTYNPPHFTGLQDPFTWRSLRAAK